MTDEYKNKLEKSLDNAAMPQEWKDILSLHR